MISLEIFSLAIQLLLSKLMINWEKLYILATSKTITPAIRIGYDSASEKIIEQLADVKCKLTMDDYFVTNGCI